MEEILYKDFKKSLLTPQKKCYNCVHRRSVPGSAHSMCSKSNALTQFDQHGISNGWAIWPFDFDPAWLNYCDSYLPKEVVFSDDFEELATESYFWLKYVQSKAYKMQDMDTFQKLKTIVDTLSPDIFKEDTEDNRKKIKELILKTRRL